MTDVKRGLKCEVSIKKPNKHKARHTIPKTSENLSVREIKIRVQKSELEFHTFE